MDNPLIELKELTKPLTKLIEVTAKGIGTIYSPFGTVRQAKANAKAKIINATADKEVRSIEQRCKSRVKHVELLRQKNLEKVVIQAALEMPNTVSDEPVSDDWIRQFFNYAQDVCDDDIQKLWSRILAGEVSSPGSYSKRTLHFLSTLEKSEAQDFTFLASHIFRLNIGQGCLLHDKVTFRYLAGTLGAAGMVDVQSHFTAIGLLSPMKLQLFSLDTEEIREIQYFDKKYLMSFIDATQHSTIPTVTYFPLSQIGEQLSRIAGTLPVEGFIDDFSAQMFKDFGVKLVEIANTVNDDTRSQRMWSKGNEWGISTR